MIEIKNPATGALLETALSDDAQQIARKYAAARSAQHEWSAAPYEQRAAIVARFGQLLEKHESELAWTTTSEMGKLLAQARGEIKGTQARIQYFLNETEARLAAAESLADGAFYNNGQSCCAVERIYVHESIHDAFVEAFVATVEGFSIGDPTVEGTYIGPVTRAAQLDVLEEQICDAVARGAEVRCGGRRLERKGNLAPADGPDVRHARDERHARGVLRPGDRHREGRERRRGRAAHERHSLRIDGRNLYAGRAPRRARSSVASIQAPCIGTAATASARAALGAGVATRASARRFRPSASTRF